MTNTVHSNIYQEKPAEAGSEFLLRGINKINGLAASSLQYSINTEQPIKKGKSKGWRLLAKK